MSLLPVFRTGLPQPASLAGASDEGRGYRFPTEHQRIPEVRQPGAAARTGRLIDRSRSAAVRTEVAGRVYAVHHRQGTQAGRLPASSVLRAGGVLPICSGEQIGSYVPAPNMWRGHRRVGFSGVAPGELDTFA